MQAGVLPELELPCERVALPETTDRASEEATDLVPAGRDEPSGDREHLARVEIPKRAHESAGDAELERGNDPFSADDSRELAERGARVVDVPEEVGERDVVERVAGKRDRIGGRLDERNTLAEPAVGDREHLGALVQPRDPEAATQELGRDEPRSGRDVEHVSAVPREPRDEEAAPERVLAEGERSADAVVRGTEWGEELSGVHGRHGSLFWGVVSLTDELERISGLAVEQAAPGDAVAAVISAEPTPGQRVYLCAFDDADRRRSWLALDAEGRPVTSRKELREAVSIAALCEVAVDAAGGGDLDTLIVRLEELRERERPQGIEAAEEAAHALRGVIAAPPQLATPARLDEIGAATRRLERELDPNPAAASPFTAAMRTSQAAVAELQREIEAGYRLPLT